MLFKWYLEEVYPGLLEDKAAVEAAYSRHLAAAAEAEAAKKEAEDATAVALRPLLEQYRKQKGLVLPPLEESDKAKMLQRERWLTGPEGSRCSLNLTDIY